MVLTKKRSDKLSELFLDVAKAMYITAFGVSFLTTVNAINSAQAFVIATFFTYLSLYMVK